MKREFGKKLIEEFFPTIDLTHVIDTSGAYIPGHGTPTVILVGRRRFARADSTIRAVLGIRGEPTQPDNPAQGMVWQAVIQQVDKPGSESEWLSVADLPRVAFGIYPWSLSGGGAPDVLEVINAQGEHLKDRIEDSIGFHDILGDDEVYVAHERPPSAWGRNQARYRRFTTGEHVRDWHADAGYALWPYVGSKAELSEQSTELYWPYRAGLRAGLTFGKTREERGMTWHEHIMLSQTRTAASHLLTFACVATHNHFVLSGGQRLHNRHAPVVKLPESATEDNHLALLGILNSSTACFWLKQVSQSKAGSGIGRGVQDEEWENRYEFTGTKLEEYPLPADLPLEPARAVSEEVRALAPGRSREGRERLGHSSGDVSEIFSRF